MQITPQRRKRTFFNSLITPKKLDISLSTLICLGSGQYSRQMTASTKTLLVWFSSQLSWQSSDILSKMTNWLHQHMKSASRDDKHHSSWSHDSFRTTRLLCISQHSYCSRGHCPDLWLWRVNPDAKRGNHLQCLKQTNTKKKQTNKQTKRKEKSVAMRLQSLGGGKTLRLHWKITQSLCDKLRQTYLLIKARYENKVGLKLAGWVSGEEVSQGYTVPLFLS